MNYHKTCNFTYPFSYLKGRIVEHKNKISLVTAILININIMVGAGIFINPPLMTQMAGGFSYVGWLLSALIILPVVISIATISRFFPQAGSFYSYSKEGINKTAGFISGWVYFLGYSATEALQMLALRDILIYQFNSGLVRDHTVIFNALFFGVFCLLCTFNLSVVGKIQSFATIFKLLPILLFAASACILLPSLFFCGGIASCSSTAAPFTLSPVFATVPFAIFGYWGFESCTHISHLLENGSKNAARSILIAFFVTTLIYTFAHAGLLMVMGTEGLASMNVTSFAHFLPVSDLIKMIVTALITCAVLSAYASAIYGELNANGFLLNAMAKEKLVFASSLLATTNKHGQPTYAIFLQGFFAFAFASAIDNKNILAAIVNLGLLSAFVLTLLSLLLIQLNRKLYPATAITLLSFFSCALLGFYSWRSIPTPATTIPFFIILGLGIAMYVVQHNSSAGKEVS